MLTCKTVTETGFMCGGSVPCSYHPQRFTMREVPVNFVPPIRHPSRQAPVATKGPWGRFGALMAHSRVKRHRWINDRCQDCGITRSGYAGGRTGFTCYHDGAGALLGFRAPPCVPVVVHDPQPLRPRT